MILQDLPISTDMLAAALPGVAAVLLSLYNWFQMRRDANLECESFVTYGAHYPVAAQRVNSRPPAKFLYIPVVIGNTGYKAGMINDIILTAKYKSDEKYLKINRRVELHKQEGSNPLVYTKQDFLEVVPAFPAYVPPQESTMILLECEDEDHEVLPLNKDLKFKITINFGQGKTSSMEMPFKVSSIDLDKSLTSIAWISALGKTPDPSSDSVLLEKLMQQTPKGYRYEDVLNSAYFDRSIQFNGKKIGKLLLHDLKLPNLPPEIGKFTELRELNLEGNRLSSLPTEIGSLKKLQTLNISSNVLTELPDSIGNLTQLKFLRLSKNQLERLPESIGNLTNLESLIVVNNKLKSLPESIGKLKNLQYLYVDHNELLDLPSSITELENLKDLWIGYNQLSSVPMDFDQLKNLENVSFDGNANISSLPNNLGNLRKLKGLDLQKTSIRTIPDSFFTLKNDMQLCYDGSSQFDPMLDQKIKNWIVEMEKQGFKIKYTAMTLSRNDHLSLGHLSMKDN